MLSSSCIKNSPVVRSNRGSFAFGRNSLSPKQTDMLPIWIRHSHPTSLFYSNLLTSSSTEVSIFPRADRLCLPGDSCLPLPVVFCRVDLIVTKPILTKVSERPTCHSEVERRRTQAPEWSLVSSWTVSAGQASQPHESWPMDLFVRRTSMQGRSLDCISYFVAIHDPSLPTRHASSGRYASGSSDYSPLTVHHVRWSLLALTLKRFEKRFEGHILMECWKFSRLRQETWKEEQRKEPFGVVE